MLCAANNASTIEGGFHGIDPDYRYWCCCLAAAADTLVVDEVIGDGASCLGILPKQVSLTHDSLLIGDTMLVSP